MHRLGRPGRAVCAPRLHSGRRPSPPPAQGHISGATSRPLLAAIAVPGFLGPVRRSAEGLCNTFSLFTCWKE